MTLHYLVYHRRHFLERPHLKTKADLCLVKKQRVIYLGVNHDNLPQKMYKSDSAINMGNIHCNRRKLWAGAAAVCVRIFISRYQTGYHYAHSGGHN